MKPIYVLSAVYALFLMSSTAGNAQQIVKTVTNQEITVPNLILFTGTMRYPNGQPRAEAIEVKVVFYSSREGGDPLWNETHLVQTDAEGNYSIYLGASAKTGLPLDLFSSQQARWLGVQIQDEEEQPRVLLVAVPYALKALDAETVGGKPLSSFVLYDDLAKVAEATSPPAERGGLNLGAAIVALEYEAKNMSSRRRNMGRNLPANSRALTPLGSEGEPPSFNTLYGLGAGIGLTTGSNNALVGSGAGYSNTTGSYNSFFGGWAGSSNTTGYNNSFIGFNAGLHNTTGSNNSIFGNWAGSSNVTGYNNSLVGVGAGSSNTTGYNNSVVGVGAGYSNTTGGNNSFLGGWAGSSSTAGFNNSFVGFNAGSNNNVGSDNSFFGIRAGSSNTYESNNTFIGSYSNGAVGITNSTAIGNQANVTQSNSLVLGSIIGVNGATADTKVGIGTTSPGEKLEVAGNLKLSGTGSKITFPDASTLSSANAARFRGITYLAGCDTCSVLLDTDDQRTIYFNLVGPMTVNSVTCFSDSGTPTVNLQRDSGTLANILTSDLTCSTTGATTTGIVSAQSVLNLNDKIDFTMVAAGGVAKRVTVAVKATIN